MSSRIRTNGTLLRVMDITSRNRFNDVARSITSCIVYYTCNQMHSKRGCGPDWETASSVTSPQPSAMLPHVTSAIIDAVTLVILTGGMAADDLRLGAYSY